MKVVFELPEELQDENWICLTDRVGQTSLLYAVLFYFIECDSFYLDHLTEQINEQNFNRILGNWIDEHANFFEAINLGMVNVKDSLLYVDMVNASKDFMLVLGDPNDERHG